MPTYCIPTGPSSIHNQVNSNLHRDVISNGPEVSYVPTEKSNATSCDATDPSATSEMEPSVFLCVYCSFETAGKAKFNVYLRNNCRTLAPAGQRFNKNNPSPGPSSIHVQIDSNFHGNSTSDGPQVS